MARVSGSMMLSVESEYAKMPAKATTTRMMADNSPESRRIGNRSRTLIVRYTTMPMNSP